MSGGFCARRASWVWLALLWVVLVLGVDTLAVQGVGFPIDWRVFRWDGPRGVDLFKLVAWFVIPFVLSLPWFEAGWFWIRRWRRSDFGLLTVLIVVGGVGVLIIPYVPSLRSTYRSLAHLPAFYKWQVFERDLYWTLSWLVGWEFMHRYFLLRPLSWRWPRFGWLIIPLVEGAYHLQKPLLEAGGMVLFSLVLTYWALRRKNVLLPFVVHLAVELELAAFRLLV